MQISYEAMKRHEIICQKIACKKMLKTVDLAKELGVSVVTIRSDLDYLDLHKRLRRVHGGAMQIFPVREEETLDITRKKFSREKKEIAEKAVSFITDRNTIAIDVGSTTLALAHAIPPDIRDLIVITNGISIALALRYHKGVKIIVTGGTFRSIQNSLVNPLATEIFQKINIDMAFIGCNGIHPQKGITNVNIEEAEVKQAMIAASCRAFILADHSKLMNITTACISPLCSAFTIITDSQTDNRILEEVRSCGATIIS